MPHAQLIRRIQWLVPVALFVLALAVRLPGLDGFITADEPKWIDRSRWFAVGLLFPEQECPPVDYGREEVSQGLGCTLQIGYPGVTTMWAGALGLLLHYYREVQPTGVDLESFLTGLSSYMLDTTIIAPSRLPFAVMGALFVPLLYGFLRRLLNTRVAMLVALIIALHPFYIALSRVVHHDSFNTMFMILSLLALIGYWLRRWPWYWLVLSGVLGGLALLSKQVSWFMPPFVAVVAGLTWLYRWVEAAPPGNRLRYLVSRQNGRTVGRLLGEGILWGVIAALTFVLLFPAMWAIPTEALTTIFINSTRLVEEGHSHFFLGEISTDPGSLFYPIGWALRATPFEVIGLVGVVGAVLTFFLRRQSVGRWLATHPVEIVLLAYAGLLLVFVSLSGKKLVRYFLPAFPIVDVFVAFGWLWWLGVLGFLLAWLFSLVKRPPRPEDAPPASVSMPQPANSSVRNGLMLALLTIIVCVQGWYVANNYPYYLTYYNPMFGGIQGAAKVMTIIGWGEGLNDAAAYLNTLPDAKSLHVLTERACTQIRPFFVGRVSCLNASLGGLLKADYVVYYYNVLQRDMPWPEQRTYFEQHQAPVKQVTIQGLDYVLIYRNPIEHQVDRKANSAAGLLGTFGYNLQPDGQLTLFWQNRGLNDAPLFVGLARTPGIYPPDGGADSSQERTWLACRPKPDFTASLTTAKAIIESNCALKSLNLEPGLYDIQLAVGDVSGVSPIETSRLAVIQIGPGGTFEPVDLVAHESVGG
ncbi:MAG: glycosyltransferase family 39 protein [Anaerolineales bacterium]|nr:glycosyltransferase family 39 protein [Anaerolineales bacterium]